MSNPTIAWTDIPSHGGRLAPGGTASGYEVRWWSTWNDHQVADVLIFRSPTDAARYVQVAGSTRCREGTSTYRAAQVPGAREILWRNPVGALQADVFFARGRRAYRISEVPPGGNVTDIETADQWLFPVAEAIACKLRDAHCRIAG